MSSADSVADSTCSVRGRHRHLVSAVSLVRHPKVAVTDERKDWPHHRHEPRYLNRHHRDPSGLFPVHKDREHISYVTPHIPSVVAGRELIHRQTSWFSCPSLTSWSRLSASLRSRFPCSECFLSASSGTHKKSFRRNLLTSRVESTGAKSNSLENGTWSKLRLDRQWVGSDVSEYRTLICHLHILNRRENLDNIHLA